MERSLMSVSFVKNGDCLRSSRFREVYWLSKCNPDLNHAEAPILQFSG
jgi:hypothetical protein